MSGSAVRIGLALAVVWGAAAIGSAADDSPAAEGTMTSKEADLWQGILALAADPAASQPYDTWSDEAEQRRAEQLRRVRSYITLYPGGVHREEAIRLELELLYELSVLRGEDPADLRRRVSELLAAAASRQTREEAAYWALIVDPAQTPVTTAAAEARATREAERLDGYREYIQRYPASRYVPRLALRVFADAEARGRWDEVRALTAQLLRQFPEHPTTEWMRARLLRRDALGRRVWPRTGRPTLVVVWAGYDAASRTALPRIESFRRAHPEVRVIGVNLDPSRAALAEAAASLGVDWPQSWDGLGWGGWFVRRWGTQQLPDVFVIDGDGRLVGIAGADEWEALVSEALARTDPVAERRAN